MMIVGHDRLLANRTEVSPVMFSSLTIGVRFICDVVRDLFVGPRILYDNYGVAALLIQRDDRFIVMARFNLVGRAVTLLKP